jgi:hypothetical protein
LIKQKNKLRLFQLRNGTLKYEKVGKNNQNY